MARSAHSEGGLARTGSITVRASCNGPHSFIQAGCAVPVVRLIQDGFLSVMLLAALLQQLQLLLAVLQLLLEAGRELVALGQLQRKLLAARLGLLELCLRGERCVQVEHAQVKQLHCVWRVCEGAWSAWALPVTPAGAAPKACSRRART